MVNDPNEPFDRRRQDVKLDAILDAQRQGMQHHIDTYHAGLTEEEIGSVIGEHRQTIKDVAALNQGLTEGARDIARILTVVEGIPDYNANGEVIGYIGGMRNDIADLKYRGNGGGGFSMRARDKAQLTALFTGIVVVLNYVKELWL